MLYVNGEYVCRGPARGYQKSWPYDEVDLSPYLRKGHNWISVRAYNAGISTFQYLHQSAGGLLCAADWGKVKIYSGPDWLGRLEPGYTPNTARFSLQLNFQEWVDARNNNQVWITSAGIPKGDGWAKPEFCRPFGVMPWHNLEKRGIPNLTNDLIAYDGTAYASSGPCAKKWREEGNLYVPFFSEQKKARKWQPAEPGRKTNSGLIFNLPRAGKGRYTSVSADMGKPCVGSFVVEAEGATGGETIDFFFTEGLFEDGRPIVGPELQSACKAAFVARLELKPGKTRYDFFQMIGHRYVVAIARETKKPIKLKLALRQAIYPFEIKGKFECDNPVFNDIYRICVQTQRVCSLDAYVDTPWREQAQWWGDARVQAKNTFYISGDTRLLKRGIRSIAQQEVPNGLTFGHAPTIAYSCILPDFSIIWALTIWDYYYQTGDKKLFIEQWPRIQRVIEYFTGEGRGENGLLKYDERYWLFLDWADIQKEGTPTLLNMWYLYMLEKLRDLAGVSGMRTEKRKFATMYDQQKKLILRHLWDAKAGLFRDGITNKSKPARRYSIHTQTLAIMCGLKEKYHSDMVAKRLLPYLQGKKVASAPPSSYWVNYVYEVMIALSYGQQVLDHMEKNWLPMIPFGGTWEMFQHDKLYPESNGFGFGITSMTHAWAAHPIYHLARTLGGVTQTGVAWKSIHFAPLLLAGETNCVNAVIPTPQGKIVSSWGRTKSGVFEVNLNLPKGIVAEVDLPGLRLKTTATRNRWCIKC